MSIAVIADSHIGGPGGAAGPLVRQIEMLDRERCDRLLMMGDLFQVWVGNPRFETADIRAVAEALEQLKRRDVRLHYIEGNRDFFLADSPYSDLFDTVGDELELESGGKRYLAVHGDGINRRDYFYRFWRLASKNRLSRLAMNRLPRGLAQRLIFGFERELRKTNFKHKKQLPVKVILEYAHRRLAEGFDVLLLGHFHEPFRSPVGEGEVIVFDAWFRSQRIEWIGDRGAQVGSS